MVHVTSPNARPPRASASAVSFWNWVVQRGLAESPRHIRFFLDCPSQASADRLSEYLRERRGYESRVNETRTSGFAKGVWHLTGRIPPVTVTLPWLEDLFDFLETAAVLCDASKPSVSMD
jgi:hypothetical protein